MLQKQMSGEGNPIWDPNVIHESNALSAWIIRERLLQAIDAKEPLSENHAQQLHDHLQSLTLNVNKAIESIGKIVVKDFSHIEGYLTAFKKANIVENVADTKEVKHQLISWYTVLTRIFVWLVNTAEPYPLDGLEHQTLINFLDHLERIEKEKSTRNYFGARSPFPLKF